MYVGPPYCRAEMYASVVICCPLVSHIEYRVCAACSIKVKNRRMDRQTDGRQANALRLPLDVATKTILYHRHLLEV